MDRSKNKFEKDQAIFNLRNEDSLNSWIFYYFVNLILSSTFYLAALILIRNLFETGPFRMIIDRHVYENFRNPSEFSYFSIRWDSQPYWLWF